MPDITCSCCETADRLVCKELLASGDPLAFTNFYNHYRPLVEEITIKKIQNTEDTKDIIQEIFINLWKYRNSLTQIENMEAWLITVTNNHIINYHNKKRHQRKIQNILLREVEFKFSYRDSEQLPTSILARTISEAIQLLPRQQRTVFILFRENHWSRKQIAKTLNITENTVRNHLYQAQKKLQSILSPSLN